jgi:hypothetical protein
MSGCGEGGGGNVQETMADVQESHKTSGRLFKLVNRMHMVRQMPQEGVMR